MRDVCLSARIKPGTRFGRFVKIGKRTWLNGSVGSYSYIGEDCRLSAEIGSFCSISPNVKTVSGTHPTDLVSTAPVFFSTQRQCGTSFAAQDVAEEGCYADPDRKIAVRIGHDVWIGENVLIKGGVRIGNGAVVAMGAVVTSDLAPYGIYGGVPAKLIRMRFPENVIAALEASAWWERDEAWLKAHAAHFQKRIATPKDVEALL